MFVSDVSTSRLQLRSIYIHRLSHHVILICLWRQRLKPSIEMYTCTQTITLCNPFLSLASAPQDFLCIYTHRISHYVILIFLWRQRLKPSIEMYTYTQTLTLCNPFFACISVSRLQFRCIYTHRLSHYVILICLWRQRLKPSIEMYTCTQTITLCNPFLSLASAPQDFLCIYTHRISHYVILIFLWRQRLKPSIEMYTYTQTLTLCNPFFACISVSRLQFRCIYTHRLSHYVILTLCNPHIM